MADYTLGELVPADLSAIWEYIALDDIDAADRFLRAAEDMFNLLGQHPELGPVWRTKSPKLQGTRFIPIRSFEKFLVFYKPRAGGVDIYHVIHGSRDLPSLLDEP
jgi:plasmid stabilization system protein ParE